MGLKLPRRVARGGGWPLRAAGSRSCEVCPRGSGVGSTRAPPLFTKAGIIYVFLALKARGRFTFRLLVAPPESPAPQDQQSGRWRMAATRFDRFGRSSASIRDRR